jgi:hypothetical protein
MISDSRIVTYEEEDVVIVEDKTICLIPAYKFLWLMVDKRDNNSD